MTRLELKFNMRKNLLIFALADLWKLLVVVFKRQVGEITTIVVL